MKKVVFFLTIFSLVFSQTFGWEDGGVPVRQGAHIEWNRAADVGEDGYMIFGWSDTRSGSRDIYVQKVDEYGIEQWDEEGLLVVGYEGRQEDPVLISDDAGGVYVIWSDFRNPPFGLGQPYAQHVSSEGTLTWNEGGIPLSENKITLNSLNMCKDGQGGAFALWKVPSSSHYASYLNRDNSDLTVEVEVIGSTWTHDGPSLETAGGGDAVMVWADARNEDMDIYAQRLGFNGNEVVMEWETIEDEDGDGDDYPKGGIPIITASGDQSKVKVTFYNENYSVIVWQDGRNDASKPDIFATFLDNSGVPPSAYEQNGLPVVSSHDVSGVEQYSEYYEHRAPRVKADQNGAFVIWNDFRNDDDGDIYIQKISPESNGIWVTSSGLPFDGIPVSEEPSAQSEYRLTVDGNNGVYVVWQQKLDDQDDIKIKHLDSNGESSYDSDGLFISNYRKDQLKPRVIKDGNDGAFVVWIDDREGSTGLYIQHLNSSGNISMEEDGLKIFYGVDFNAYLYDNPDSPIEDLLHLTPKSLYLGNDQTLLFWEDGRHGQPDTASVNYITAYAYAELIDLNYEYTGTNGIMLSETPMQFNPSVNLNDNGYLYHYIGPKEGGLSLYVEQLDNSFSSNDMEPVYDGDLPDWTDQNKFSSVYNVNGELFVLYQASLMGAYPSIWFQAYTPNGTTLFSNSIQVDFTSDGKNHFLREVFQNPSGGVMVVEEVKDGDDRDIRVFGINDDGSYWDNATSIITNDAPQEFQDAVATNTGVFITWKHFNNTDHDVFGQHISYDGTILSSSDNGISICENSEGQLNASVAFVSTTNIVTTCWEDHRSGSEYDIYCREYNTVSDISSNEFVLSNAEGDQSNPFLYTSLTNTILAVWEDTRSGTYRDIYLQELVNGNSAFANNGIVACDAFHDQLNPRINLLSDQAETSYLIYWEDLRGSGKENIVNIFAQKLVKEDCLGDDNGTAWFNPCGECVSEGDMSCVQGCDGNWASGGSALEDVGCGCGEPAPVNYYIDNDGDGLGGEILAYSHECNDPGAGFVSNSDDDDDQCDGVLDDCIICNGNNADKDCNGDCFGVAFIDDCGICSGGLTNHGENSSMDECGCCPGTLSPTDNLDNFCGDSGGFCDGSYNGCQDECGICNGNNADKDCLGVCFGDSELDNCGNCDLDASNDCVVDCSETELACDGTWFEGKCWGGASVIDACNVCGNGCYEQDCDTNPIDQYDCEGVVLSIGELTPTEFGLMQNYPNPFNPSTSINFSIPEFSMVSISIYNVNGQKVKSLLQSTMSPGYHQVIWYGDDNNGASVSNGIYFYIMETSSFIEKRKMLFIK